MSTVKCKLTLYFEDPFWVGIFEQTYDNKLRVSKVTFGKEPKDYEIQRYILKYYDRLQFSPAIETDVHEAKKNLKRRLREVKKQLQNKGIGTKSQQALKLHQEQNKQNRKIQSHNQKRIDAKRMFELKQQKKKMKHRGINLTFHFKKLI